MNFKTITYVGKNGWSNYPKSPNVGNWFLYVMKLVTDSSLTSIFQLLESSMNIFSESIRDVELIMIFYYFIIIIIIIILLIQ